MYKNKYIILLLLFFIIIFCLYLLINYCKKQMIIKEIIEQWKNKTGSGYIKLDDNGDYEGDYYLSINNFDDRYSHIHLIATCNKSDLCYIIKKYNHHSQLYIIDINRNPNSILNEMIRNFYNFKD